MMKLKKLFVLLVACSTLVSCNKTTNESFANQFDEPVLKITNVDDLEIKKEADTYNLIYKGSNIFVEASKNYSTSSFNGIEELSAINEERVTVVYNIEYDTKNFKIYLENKFIGENGEVYFEEKIQGDPVYYEDGTNDAVFFENDQPIYFSSLDSEKESCWLLTSLFVSALVSVVVKAVLKACVIVLCTVIIAGCVYQIVKVTVDAILKAMAKAEEERKKGTTKVYFLAQKNGNGLGISEKAFTSDEAASRMISYNNSFWAPTYIEAYNVTKKAGNGKTPIDEIDRDSSNRPINGRYWHCHPYNRTPNTHCWYGTPYNGYYY